MSRTKNPGVTEIADVGWAIIIPFATRKAAEETARQLANGHQLLHPRLCHLRPTIGPDGFGARVEIDAETQPA